MKIPFVPTDSAAYHPNPQQFMAMRSGLTISFAMQREGYCTMHSSVVLVHFAKSKIRDQDEAKTVVFCYCGEDKEKRRSKVNFLPMGNRRR